MASCIDYRNEAWKRRIEREFGGEQRAGGDSYCPECGVYHPAGMHLQTFPPPLSIAERFAKLERQITELEIEIIKMKEKE